MRGPDGRLGRRVSQISRGGEHGFTGTKRDQLQDAGKQYGSSETRSRLCQGWGILEIMRIVGVGQAWRQAYARHRAKQAKSHRGSM